MEKVNKIVLYGRRNKALRKAIVSSIDGGPKWSKLNLNMESGFLEGDTTKTVSRRWFLPNLTQVISFSSKDINECLRYFASTNYGFDKGKTTIQVEKTKKNRFRVVLSNEV